MTRQCNNTYTIASVTTIKSETYTMHNQYTSDQKVSYWWNCSLNKIDWCFILPLFVLIFLVPLENTFCRCNTDYQMLSGLYNKCLLLTPLICTSISYRLCNYLLLFVLTLLIFITFYSTVFCLQILSRFRLDIILQILLILFTYSHISILFDQWNVFNLLSLLSSLLYDKVLMTTQTFE